MASHLRIQAPRPPPPASLGMKGPPCRAPWAAPTRNFSLRGSAKLPSVHAAPDVSFFIIQNSFSPHISSFHLHDTYFVCPDSFRLQNRVSPSPQSVWLPTLCSHLCEVRSPSCGLFLPPASAQPHAHSFTICPHSVLCSSHLGHLQAILPPR